MGSQQQWFVTHFSNEIVGGAVVLLLRLAGGDGAAVVAGDGKLFGNLLERSVRSAHAQNTTSWMSVGVHATELAGDLLSFPPPPSAVPDTL